MVSSEKSFYSPLTTHYSLFNKKDKDMTKTIVITGATSGIGNLLVKEFIKQGCLVFAGYRNSKFKKDLEKISPNVVPFRIDMSKEWTIKEAIDFINSKTDVIDTLINAAGCVVAGPMECLSVEKIREQFEVNTFSHLQLTQGLFEALDGGKIINISSMASFGVFPLVASYCASKRALDILFNAMQIECGGKCDSDSEQNTTTTCNRADIKVISVKPGVIKTPLWEKAIESNKDFLDEGSKYEKEMNFLIKNAEKNKDKGLEAQEVADFIVKIEALDNPKPSYTIGQDAKWAEILSHFPQAWINWIVKTALKERIKKA